MKTYTQADKVRFAEYRLSDASHIKDILQFIQKSGVFPISDDLIESAERMRLQAERSLKWLQSSQPDKRKRA